MGWVRNALKATLSPKLMEAALHLNRSYLMSYGRHSYSQEGEDVLAAKIFEHKTSPGFYVDIGAYHPVSVSNTYLLYRRGWRGIVIEPLPGAAALFRKRRPRDIALEMGIAEQPGSLTYFRFDSAAHNTFDRDQRDVVLSQGHKLLEEVPVRVERLDAVLAQYLPDGTAIDFMSIDVEGRELQVLASNDWTRFRPSIICMEMLMVRADEVKDSPTARFLLDRGYRFIAKLDNSTFFQDEAFCYSDRDYAERHGALPRYAGAQRVPASAAAG